MIIETVAEDSIRVYLSKEKKLRFKAACVLQDRDMSDVINEMIDQWLEQNEIPPQPKKSTWEGDRLSRISEITVPILGSV